MIRPFDLFFDLSSFLSREVSFETRITWIPSVGRIVNQTTFAEIDNTDNNSLADDKTKISRKKLWREWAFSCKFQYPLYSLIIQQYTKQTRYLLIVVVRVFHISIYIHERDHCCVTTWGYNRYHGEIRMNG